MNSKIETLAYSDYHKRPVGESKIIPGLRVLHSGEGEMTCPRCGGGQRGIEHGGFRECPGCGLYMMVFGNALQISTDKNAWNGTGH